MRYLASVEEKKAARERFKEVRESTKLNQKDFAKRLGYSSQLINMIESGKADISFPVARLIEVETGVSAMWLLYGESPRLANVRSAKAKDLDEYLDCFPAISDFLKQTLQKLELDDWFVLNNLCKKMLKKDTGCAQT